MKRTITIICDVETTVPHLLNSNDFEVISTGKEDVWTLIKKEPDGSGGTGTMPLATYNCGGHT